MAPTNSQFPNNLRQIIKQRGLTVDGVAEDASIPLRTLFDYCAGRVPIPKERRETLARVIGVPTHSLVPPFAGICTPSLLQYESEQADGWISSGVLSNLDNLRRKILHQLLNSTNIMIVVPREELLNIDAWEKLALALKDPSRTDGATLTHLEQLTNTYWELYRSATAKRDLLSSVSGHLVTLTQLLHTSQPLASQSRLCCVTSNTCQIIGEIYFDMNNVATAEAYYNLAIKTAHEVGNDPLEALALGKIGVLSVYRGAYSESLPILQRAYALADNTTTGKSKSWLKWKEAEALSGLQKKDDCIAAVHQAEEVSDQDGSSSTGEDRHCTGPLIGYKGICYVHLHLPNEAQPLLLSALQQLPSDQARRRKAQILTNLASTYVWQQEIEEACKVASQALLCAALTKSSWAVSNLRNFQKEIGPWKDVYCVKKFNKLLNTIKGL